MRTLPHTICTPARAALLTGRLQSTNARVISRANRQGLEPSVDFSATLSSEPTIATRLSATGSFVCGMFGKWHLHTWTDPRDQARCSAGWSNFSTGVLAQVHAGIVRAGFQAEAKAVSPCNRASNAAHDLDAIVESAPSLHLTHRFDRASTSRRPPSLLCIRCAHTDARAFRVGYTCATAAGGASIQRSTRRWRGPT